MSASASTEEEEEELDYIPLPSPVARQRRRSPASSASTSPVPTGVSTIHSLHACLATSRSKKVRDEFQEFLKKCNSSFSQFSLDVDDSKTGKTFEQTYDVGEVLGEGGYATVYRCHHKANDMNYAVKVVNKEEYESEGENLKEEIAALKVFADYLFCVRLLDVFEEPERTYLVMEECKGGDLLDKITEKEYYPENEAKKLCRTLLEAINHFHKKRIAHRDIKPENILLVSKTDDTSIKITDFGCAKFVTGPKCLKTMCGSPQYVAPEVFERDGYDQRCDLWSAGVVIFVVLGGYAPFDAPLHELPRVICEGHYEFDEEYWGEISYDAKHVVKMLLRVNADVRASASACLNSPWLQRGDLHLALDGSARSIEGASAISSLNDSVSWHASSTFSVDLKPVEQRRGQLRRERSRDEELIEWFRTLPAVKTRNGKKKS